MTSACGILHEVFNALPRLAGNNDLAKLPTSGIYVVFEEGERAHGADRIVRVGTHSGEENLRLRLGEHLYKMNKDRSIFRKHIGRCILRRRNDPFAAHWELDLTTPAVREKYRHLVSQERQLEIEAEVTAYVTSKLSFTAIEMRHERLALEARLIGTFAQCTNCAPSTSWLGLHHPDAKIRSTGMWNIHHLRMRPMSAEDGLALLPTII